jgi:hypothetical protein
MSGQPWIPFDFDWAFWSYYTGTLLAPLFALLVNFRVRGWKNAYLTGGADFTLMQATFCLTALILSKDTAQYIRRKDFQENIVPIFTIMLVLTGLLWLWTMVNVESEPHVFTSGSWIQRARKQVQILFAWFASIGLFSTIAGVFLAKPRM